MPITQQLLTALRQQAATLDQLDRASYHALGKDPLEPIIGHGAAASRIAFFGRDPGKEEIRHALPFIGAAGQQVRRQLHLHRTPDLPFDFAASLAVGADLFWANTVPYKPIGNKAWSMAVKRRFQPLVAQLLIDHWQGHDIITLGREAFLWFGILQPQAQRHALEQFWASEERFSASLPIQLTHPERPPKTLHLHPLPHPSPLNATWYKRFPQLLQQRLEQLV